MGVALTGIRSRDISLRDKTKGAEGRSECAGYLLLKGNPVNKAQQEHSSKERCKESKD